jgi:hypothetical protein
MQQQERTQTIERGPYCLPGCSAQNSRARRQVILSTAGNRGRADFRGRIRFTARRESKQTALQSLRAEKLSMGDCNWSCCVRDVRVAFSSKAIAPSKQEWAHWLSGYWQQKANEIALLTLTAIAKACAFHSPFFGSMSESRRQRSKCPAQGVLSELRLTQ